MFKWFWTIFSLGAPENMRRDSCIVVHLLPQTFDFFPLYDIKIAQESPGFDVFSGLPSNAIIALIWEPFKTMIYSLPKYLNELGAFSRISTTLSISEAVYVVYIPSSDYSENVTAKKCSVSISAARAKFNSTQI